MVTVTAPDAALKKTVSEEVGTASPPEPPLVKDHLLPAVVSHDSVPPTQYLFAMCYPIKIPGPNKMPGPIETGPPGLARFTVLLVALSNPVPPAPVHILTVKVKSACEMPSVTVTIENEPAPPVAVYDPVTAEKLLSVVVPFTIFQYRVAFANEPVELVSNVPVEPFVILVGTEVKVTLADGAINYSWTLTITTKPFPVGDATSTVNAS
jgi:hypothetical protein